MGVALASAASLPIGTLLPRSLAAQAAWKPTQGLRRSSLPLPAARPTSWPA
jgi:hypothetical protein